MGVSQAANNTTNKPPSGSTTPLRLPIRKDLALLLPSAHIGMEMNVSFNYFKAWEDEEEATAINVCEMSDEALDSFETKTMNGVFSVTGQKVSNTLNGLTKGIYIFNGRKVIVK